MGFSSFHFFFIILLSASFFNDNSVTEALDLIKKTCQNTQYYDLCVSLLKSDPASAKTKDSKGLALIMVNAGLANATATATYLSSQLHSASVNDTTSIKEVLKECANKYSNAVESLKASIGHLTMENYDYAYIDVFAASDYPNSCHDMFRKYPSLAYPLEIERREASLNHICFVIMGIIDILSGS